MQDRNTSIEEALGFYFVMIQIKHYDRQNLYIKPALELVDPKILKFFQERTGYLEVVCRRYNNAHAHASIYTHLYFIASDRIFLLLISFSCAIGVSH